MSEFDNKNQTKPTNNQESVSLNINLDALDIQKQAQNQITKASNSKTSKGNTNTLETQKQASNNVISFDMNQFAEAISKTLDISQQKREERIREENFIEHQKKLEQATDKSGIASSNFRKLMEKEIKEGRYTAFRYFDAFAKKHGRKATLNINGFQMDFLLNETTLVPNVLLPHVNLKFGGLSIGRGGITQIGTSNEGGKTESISAKELSDVSAAIEEDIRNGMVNARLKTF